MKKIVTADEMREKDRFTIEEIGIPSVVLMENAGRAVSRIIQEELKEIKDPVVYILCGKGNNGGDGFVVARHLWNEGVYVRILCTVKEEEISGDALINYTILKNMNLSIEFIDKIKDLEFCQSSPPHIFVDALLGTGIQGPVKGFFKQVIEFINHNIETKVISVDLPSGLNASSGEVAGSAIRANITVTMALAKICHVLHPAKSHIGNLHIVKIGIPPYLLSQDNVKVEMLEKEDIVLPFRYEDTHKYECGKIAVLAGSKGYTGAAVLTAQAAMRMGSGLVILGIPESINPVMEQKLTEVITRPLPETDQQTIGRMSFSGIQDLLDWCDVLAIGPGLGRSLEVQETIISILEFFKKPIVIDADALYALANHPGILNKEAHPNWILTPHMGEFLRFFPKEKKASIIKQRIDKAQQFAYQYGLTLLLKGAPALVASADRHIYLNPTGNSGLASAGTGDVLTGLIAGLLGQSYSPDEAGYTANFIHGHTADFITEKTTNYTLLANELIDHLGFSLNQLLAKG